MIRVCFYGAESTGKSEMAKRMASHYDTEFVPEVAREMISSNDFSVEDVIEIGKAQTARIIEKCKTANRILFCDTDLITTQIYSHQYLNQVPALLYQLEQQIKYDKYFFFDIDVPWVPDGLRDLERKRSMMSHKFKSELNKRKIRYVLVHGDWDERFDIIKMEVDKLLEIKSRLR